VRRLFDVCIQFNENGQVGGYRLGNRSGQLVMMQYSAAPPQHKCTVQSHMCQSIPVDPLDIQSIQRSCVADRIGNRSVQLVIAQISSQHVQQAVYHQCLDWLLGWLIMMICMHATYMVITVRYLLIESGIVPVSRLLAKLLCTICSSNVHMAARIRLRLG
jgi:hypothetical protein